MKKIYIALTVVMAVMLASCEKEKSFERTPLGENEICFTMTGVGTRASEGLAMPVKGVTIPMGTASNGETLFLEETIEELNPSPSTKGAPAYTVNLGTLYTNMGVYAEGGSFGGDALYEVIDKYINKDESLGEGWRYTHNYKGSPWPEDEEEKIDFYLRMPASQSNVTDLEYKDKTIEFNYDSPLTGAAQEDILFSYTSLSKKEHDGYLANGAPVLMQHALTGVKFRTGHTNAKTTHTIITKVEITGLKDKGTCTVDFTGTTPTITWDASPNGKTFSQQFENPDYEYTKDASGKATVTSGDGTIGTEGDDDHKWNADLSGTSWVSAAADKNLNDKDGSLTFWFIPQQLNTDVTLKVTFVVKTPEATTSGPDGAGVVTHTIKLGDLTRKQTKNDDGSITYGAYANWEAGQLRTYTLKPSDVDVDIFDELEGLEKDDLHVTNTGNVDEYVRMMLVGNWYDADGNILVGYKYPTGTTVFDEGDDINTMVTPWYREDPLYCKYFDEETFKNGKPCGDNPWILGTGSYFYYPEVIGAGDKLSGTDALFQSYKLPESVIPTIWIQKAGAAERVKAEGVHLVMEVVVQAIGTTNPESATGDPFGSWQEAWTYVTGKEIDAE